MMTPLRAESQHDTDANSAEADWQVVEKIPPAATTTPATSTTTTTSNLSIGSKAKRDSHKRQGDAAFRNGNYKEAVEEYKCALQVDPTNFLLLSNRSAAYLKLGQTQQALEDAQQCIKADSTTPRGHSRLGAALQTLQKWESATKAYEKVLELDPNNEVAKREVEVCKKYTQQQNEKPVQTKQEPNSNGSKSMSLQELQEQQLEQLQMKKETEPVKQAQDILPNSASPETKPSANGVATPAVASPAAANVGSSPTHSPVADSIDSAAASPRQNTPTSMASRVPFGRVPTAFVQSTQSPTRQEVRKFSPAASPVKQAAAPVGVQSPDANVNQSASSGPATPPKLPDANPAATPEPKVQNGAASLATIVAHSPVLPEQSVSPLQNGTAPAASVAVPSATAPDAHCKHVQSADISTQAASFASAQPTFASPSLSKQPPHSSARTNTGLSELSKQLRVLQATNESQANQIDRLERQLRIMAELKGVSVGDLRSALLTACEEEAHADLQNQIAYWKSRFEAAELTKSKKNAASFEKESMAKQIANLQLKLAENEELEETLRGEIRGLYQELSQEQSKSATLHSTCESQKQQLDELLRKCALVKVETQQSQWALPVAEPPPEPENKLVVHAEALRNAELQARLEKDRANLLETQAQAREKEAQLRNEQYKSRFQVQDERIFDLEQQLSSLYTAFELLQQEHAGDQEKRALLSTNLAEADSQVARQLHSKMASERSLGTPVQGTPVAAAAAPATPMSSYSTTSSVQPPSSSFVYIPPSTPPKASPKKLYREKSLKLQATPSVIESQHVASGYLLKRDKNLLRGGWKKRYFVLHGSDGTYHLSYSEGPREKIKGTIGFIKTGVSTVNQSYEFPKQPFVFVLHPNPSDTKAPVLYASAANEQEYERWLSALTLVTTGHDSTVATRTPQEQEAADHEVALRMQMEYMSE